MQPGGRLPRAEPARQLDRAHPALALAQVVDRQKPGGQRQLGPVERRPGGQADLALAAVALVDRAALELGAAPVAAARTDPALAPAQLEQRRPARRLRPVAGRNSASLSPLTRRRSPLSAPIRSLRNARNPREY